MKSRVGPAAAATALALALLTAPGTDAGPVASLSSPQEPARRERTPPKPQTRPHGTRVAIDPPTLSVEDGDTAVVRWPTGDTETVRILGIDTPETRQPEHDLPYGQPFGEEARAFGQGAFAATRRIELVRAATLDPYGRTLGYFYLDGENYSVLVVRARLAEETLSRYGDNGLPREAGEVAAAAKTAGPLPFESPGAFRARMRDVSRWMKSRGIYPTR